MVADIPLNYVFHQAPGTRAGPRLDKNSTLQSREDDGSAPLIKTKYIDTLNAS